jgi:hypothetical protein
MRKGGGSSSFLSYCVNSSLDSTDEGEEHSTGASDSGWLGVGVVGREDISVAVDDNSDEVSEYCDS